jgi:hypothetical protein
LSAVRKSIVRAAVLLQKLREAMAEELKGRVIGGEGKVAEVDGGYFGGYVKPANQRENAHAGSKARCALSTIANSVS